MEKWKRHWHAIPFELDWKIFHSKQCSLLHAEHFSWLQSRCYASNMFFMSEAEDIKPNTKTESKLLLSFMCRFASFYFLFLDELQQVFFCGTSYSIETLMRIPLKPRKKISSVWIFLKVGGKFRFVGKFGNNQHWWCLTNQPAIVRPIYAERGTVSKSWQGHTKAQGNIHSELQRQEFIKLDEKKTYFSLKRNYIILNLI